MITLKILLQHSFRNPYSLNSTAVSAIFHRRAAARSEVSRQQCRFQFVRLSCRPIYLSGLYNWISYWVRLGHYLRARTLLTCAKPLCEGRVGLPLRARPKLPPRLTFQRDRTLFPFGCVSLTSCFVT